MSSADKIEVIIFQKSFNNGGRENDRDTTVIRAPAIDVRIRVTPEEITEDALFRDVRGPDNLADLVHIFEFRAKSTVHADDLVIQNGHHGKAVEAIGENLPEFNGVPPLALVIEAVDPVDTSTLVVSSREEEILGVFDLVG